jgi:ferric-dicitrate binding protein FerR (iron transport regulator)
MEKFELIYAIFSQTASPEEEFLFKELMAERKNRELFEQVKKIWAGSGEVKKFQNRDSAQAFYQINKKIENRKVLRKRYFFTALSGVAAGIIILFGLFQLTGTRHMKSSDPAQIHFQTELGNRSVVYLPDGSKVWLNAQSDLKYETGFNISDRTVFLTGEAYFEVEKGEVPFIVDVNDFKVKVYGTKFNISAYADDPIIATCLETGNISILSPKSEEFDVKPGELAVYEKSTSKLKIKTVDPDEYSGWRLNKIYLHNEPIGVLARKLERQYNITIGFTPSNIGQKIHYSGVFGNENLEEILEAISTASGLHYQKNGNHYEIIKK